MINKSFRIYHKEIANKAILTKEDEARICEDFKVGGQKKDLARTQLIESHLKLAAKMASDFEGLGVPIEDLTSEANIGVMMAADRFDPEKGSRFTCYAMCWIKQRVCKALYEKARTIRIPNGSMQKFLKLLEFSKEYEDKHGEKPSLSLLSEKFRMSIDRIKSIFISTEIPVSIHERACVDNYRELDNTSEMEEYIADEKLKSIEDDLTEEEHKGILNEALDKLNEREKFVISRRFGLGNNDEETLMEIGNKLNLTRERVRQIETGAMKKMQAALKKVKLEFIA